MKRGALNKKLDKLRILGADETTIQQLDTDLSHSQVDASQAKFLLGWWEARLAGLKIVEEDNLSPSDERKLLDILHNYANAHKISITFPPRYDMDMKMFRQPRTGAAPKIRANIKTVRIDR